MLTRPLLISIVALAPTIALAQADTGQLKVPFKFALGKGLYEKNCGECHGREGFGVEKKGPPLIHKYYEPSHHGDESFYRAVLHGTRQHHWNFGDMEPIPGVSRKAVSKIVPYVRWLQREHGIN